MKIKNDIINQIRSISCNSHFEIGGILGSSENETITEIFFDLPEKKIGCKFEYSPNVDFLNKQIEVWAEKGIDFSGIFHTHFSGSRSLSETDKLYITEIMESAKGIVEHLYFPIFTLPDNILTVYKAFFSNGKVVVEKDELTIIQY